MKFIAILLLGGLLHVSGAKACVCALPEGSLDDYVAALYSESALVGIFEVEGFRFGTELLRGEQERGRWAVLRQRRSFKGEASELLVRAPIRLFGTNCDMRYRKGELLLVYARTIEALSFNMCSSSGHLMSRFGEIPLLFRLANDD